MRLLSATLAALLMAAPAAAQEDEAAPLVVDEPKPEPVGEIRAEGEYSGVAPGKQPAAEKKARRPPARPKKPTIMWIGFQPLDAGSSRVFLQLSTTAAHEQAIVGNDLVVTLPDFRLDKRNDLRPLDTRFFDGAVARVTAVPLKARGKKARKGIEVRISFKDGVAPRQGDARLEQSPSDGWTYLYLDFGPAAAAQ